MAYKNKHLFFPHLHSTAALIQAAGRVQIWSTCLLIREPKLKECHPLGMFSWCKARVQESNW